MEITAGELKRNETTEKAMGGTELLAHGLFARADKELLKDFQIVCSRKRELRDDLIRIFWCHDLPGDPESEFLSDPANHKLFHRYVFVSNWQMQAYINAFGLPWSKCIVIQNAIEPIPAHEKPHEVFEQELLRGKIHQPFTKENPLNFVYFSTPHRGLDIATSVFLELAKKYDNIHFNVYSSFNLYGWPQRDEPFKEIFKVIEGHDQMTYHGAVSNDEIRKALQDQHILAYPSTWPETSCLTLMESMSARLMCVHSNYAALPETAANMTMMYQYSEDKREHAQTFYNVCEAAISHYGDEFTQNRLCTMKNYADTFYSWEGRTRQWNAFLTSMKDKVKDRKIPESEVLVFQTA